MNPLYAAALFLFALVTDVAWVRWTMASNRKQPLQASLWGIGIYVFGAIGTIAYVANPFYVAVLALGSGVGTYVTVLHDKHKEGQHDSS